MTLQPNSVIEKNEAIIFYGLAYEAEHFDEIEAKPDGNCFWHCAKNIFDLIAGQPKFKDCGRAKNDLINTIVDIVKGNIM